MGLQFYRCRKSRSGEQYNELIFGIVTKGEILSEQSIEKVYPCLNGRIMTPFSVSDFLMKFDISSLTLMGFDQALAELPLLAKGQFASFRFYKELKPGMRVPEEGHVFGVVMKGNVLSNESVLKIYKCTGDKCLLSFSVTEYLTPKLNVSRLVLTTYDEAMAKVPCIAELYSWMDKCSSEQKGVKNTYLQFYRCGGSDLIVPFEELIFGFVTTDGTLSEQSIVSLYESQYGQVRKRSVGNFLKTPLFRCLTPLTYDEAMFGLGDIADLYRWR